MRIYVKETKIYSLEFTEDELKMHTNMLLNVNPVNAEMIVFKKEQKIQCESALRGPAKSPIADHPTSPPGLSD